MKRCFLTKDTGKFVKCHLIPKALTYPEERGLPFNQFGSGHRTQRRWSSWYDDGLATRTGEDILADLDNWAVREFRRQRLVWSGWGPALRLGEPDITDLGNGWAVRNVIVPEKAKFRLFFLSLLWRAAATGRAEFSEIQVPSDDLETLRRSVISGSLPPPDFYPVFLIQLSTRGLVHNHAPFADEKRIPSFDSKPERTITIFMLYFDGLISHFHRQSSDNGETVELGP